MLESTYVLSEDSDNIKDVLTKKLMTDFKKVRELGPGGLPPIGDISYTPNPNDPFPPLPPGERPIIDDFDLHKPVRGHWHRHCYCYWHWCPWFCYDTWKPIPKFLPDSFGNLVTTLRSLQRVTLLKDTDLREKQFHIAFDGVEQALSQLHKGSPQKVENASPKSDLLITLNMLISSHLLNKDRETLVKSVNKQLIKNYNLVTKLFRDTKFRDNFTNFCERYYPVCQLRLPKEWPPEIADPFPAELENLINIIGIFYRVAEISDDALKKQSLEFIEKVTEQALDKYLQVNQ